MCLTPESSLPRGFPLQPSPQSSKPEATSLSYLFILLLMPATHTCTGCLSLSLSHTHTRAQAVTEQNPNKTLALRFPTPHTQTHAVMEQKAKLLWLTCSNTSVTMISCQVSLLFLPCWLQCPFPPTPVVFSSSVHKALIPEASTAGCPVSLISEACPDRTPPHHPNQYP